MVILLSIKPEFTKRIFSGEKKFEFRKQKPNFPTTLVFIYESFPTKKIVGWFTVRKIISGTPAEIWKHCGDKGGISQLKFFEYCQDNDIIYAFEIGKSSRFPNPVDPVKLDANFKPPQNFSYRNYAIPQIGFDEQKVLDDV
jgi:predicted transcriptional regulator